MEEGQPSRTALMMAVLRAHHYLSTEEPRVFSDSLAMRFAGLSSPADVGVWVDRVTERLMAYGGHEEAAAAVQRLTMLSCARSRFVEDQLEASLARGVTQLVVLGAGLDSTGYRRTEIAGGLRIFEVDYPATQGWKRDKLASIGVAIPANLTFVPCDFEHQTLPEALAAGGVRSDEMTLFSWLGVQAYLTDDAVMSTLEVIAKFPAGSELVMDLATRGVVVRDRMAEGGGQILAAMGEPFKSAYPPDLFEARLRERGYTRIDIVTVPDWLLRHSASFGGRFSTYPASSILVSAQVA